ncbi:MAG: choice-of-anchor J domain-containing protein [Bacteroidales bacterium]
MDDVYKELDERVEPYHENIEYTLTSNDYETLTSYALADAENELDSTWAEYLSNFKAFNDSFAGADYVPYLLSDLFPALNKSSAANVTFNHIAELPDELAAYTNTIFYQLSSTDYESISSSVGEVGYFYPDYSPDLFIPGILSSSITDATQDDIYRVNYLFSDKKPVIPETAAVTTYSEEFTENLNAVDTFSIVGDAQRWEWDSYGSDTYAKMSGYDGGANENEDWLVTPEITVNTGVNTILNIIQAINFLNDQMEQLDILVSTDYTGDVTTASWTSIKDDVNMPAGNSWTFVESGDVSLNAFEGETINIAFKYTSSTSNAATWEISDIKVLEGEKILEDEPYELNDYYQYDQGAWVKMSEVYYLNPKDYDAMGSPGNYDNFSGDDSPRDYIPNLLRSMYPTAGEGVSKFVVYKYYTGIEGTLTLADEYTYTNGEWQSLYNYIDETTQQFIHNGENWVFDPTIEFTMSGTDYQTIVDYVKNEISQDYIDSYGTGEFYYGASSYYSNFDLRLGKRDEFNIPGFDGLSQDEAIDETWKRIPEAIDILLKQKYPEATAAVSGVDVHYYVTFYTYEHDLSKNYYTIHFQCTKDGPDPEFTQDTDYADEPETVYGKYGMRRIEE